MVKVSEILFDDDKGQPIFVLEDGTKRYPYEMPTGNCWYLSWRKEPLVPAPGGSEGKE